jgi:N-methylhydantoinase B
MDVVYSSDGLRNPPFGALGATAGAGGGSYVEGRGELRPLPVHVEETVSRDEAWTAISTGGGGYGNPLERPIEQVRRDVRDGLYGPGAATAAFGVFLSDDADPVVDGPATRSRREEIARHQAERGLPLVMPDKPGAARWRPA